MANFGDALRKGLAFSIEPKRWLPLFIADLPFIGFFFLSMRSLIHDIMPGIAASGPDSASFLPLAGYMAGLFLLLVAWYIIRIWIMGSLIHQSRKPAEAVRGYEISLGRLHRMISVALLVGIISGFLSAVLSIIPMAGAVAGIIVGIAFFFMSQGIIVDNLGIISTLKNSYRIFRKSPFDVFIAWLLIAVISGIIMLLFALPLIYMFAGLFMELAFSGAFPVSGSDAAAFAMLSMLIESSLGTIAALGLVALVGFEIAQVFALRAQTEFYMQFRKRFPGIIKMFSDRIGRFF